MKNRYLIDYENVANAGLSGVEDLTENDEVIIFYSSNVNTMTFDTHYKLMNTKANIITKSVEIGTKNALDFQLSTMLGYLVAKDPQHKWKFHIVSHDTGFDHVLRFWREHDVIIDRRVAINAEVLPLKEPKEPQEHEPVKEPPKPKEFTTREQFLEDRVRQFLPDNRKTSSHIITQALIANKDRKSFNKYLTKHGVQNVSDLASCLGNFFVDGKISLTDVNKEYNDALGQFLVSKNT